MKKDSRDVVWAIFLWSKTELGRILCFFLVWFLRVFPRSNKHVVCFLLVFSEGFCCGEDSQASSLFESIVLEDTLAERLKWSTNALLNAQQNGTPFRHLAVLFGSSTPFETILGGSKHLKTYLFCDADPPIVVHSKGFCAGYSQRGG